MMKNYRIIKVTEANNLGVERTYYKIQKRFKFLGLIGLNWYDVVVKKLFNRNTDFIPDMNIHTVRNLNEIYWTSDVIFNDLEIAKSVKFILERYPKEIFPYYSELYKSIVYVVPEFNPKNSEHLRNKGRYFLTIKDAIGYLNSTYYKVKSIENL